MTSPASVRTSHDARAPLGRGSAATETRKLGHVNAFDGVRGLAILMVMVFHLTMVTPVGSLARWWWRVAQHGGLGVDVFFVLSGFLITGILLRARERPHYFRNFYARRVLRIWPLYYVVVLLSLCVLPVVAPSTVVRYAAVNRDAIWYWLHLSNFAIAKHGAFVHGILDVSWSLAIEEQFYLLWPAAVCFMSLRRLRWVCLALALLSSASRTVLTAKGVNAVAVYTLTFCRLDGLAIGALVAIALHGGTLRADRPWGRWALALALTVVLVVAFPNRDLHRLGIHAGLGQLLASCSSACVVAGIASRQASVTRIFDVAPLRVLGRYSYALYLFHYPIAATFRDLVLKSARLGPIVGSSAPTQLLFYAACGTASFVLAQLSWHLLEARFLSLKRFFA